MLCQLIEFPLCAGTSYYPHITRNVHERKVCEFCESWDIRKHFLMNFLKLNYHGSIHYSWIYKASRFYFWKSITVEWHNWLIVNAILYSVISRHTVVCRAAQETRSARQTSVYFTGVKKTPFSRICSSTVPKQKHTKFSVWITSGWGTSNSKFKLNPPSCSRDMRLQSSSYFLHIFLLLLLLFATLFEIAITHACFDGLSWNLERY